VKIIIAIALLASSLLAPAAMAQSIRCGIKPIPPIGCKAEDAHCVCTAQGQCHWEFDC
jgi:hypothetical protein